MTNENGRQLLNARIDPELIKALNVFSAKRSIFLYLMVEELLREALEARGASVEELIS